MLMEVLNKKFIEKNFTQRWTQHFSFEDSKQVYACGVQSGDWSQQNLWNMIGSNDS